MTTLPSGRRRSMDPRSAPGMLEGFPRLEPPLVPRTAISTVLRMLLCLGCVGLLAPLDAQTQEVPELIRTQQVVITITGLSQVYNGQPRAVSVSTAPAGVSVQVTYSGSGNPPTNPGSYSVVATVTEANFAGTATATEIISSGNSTTATTGTTGTTDTSGSGSTGGSAAPSSGSSSGSSFLNGLPCGLGSGSGMLLAIALWWRRRS
jgi:hypothetical protein